MIEKEKIFESVFELAAQFEDKEPDEITDLQREEVEKMRELFITKTKDLGNCIMSNEITLVNQIEHVRKSFILVEITVVWLKCTLRGRIKRNKYLMVLFVIN